jgi:hypothetical protein
MSEDNFFKKLLKRLTTGMRASQPQSADQQAAEKMSKLFQMVANTDEVEISCDDVFELLDLYVEYEARGGDAASLWPRVKKHLDDCQDCHEEYEALLRVIRASPGLFV